MTVAELVAQLQLLDQDRIVILQKDAEGNGFSPLESVWGGNGCYRPDNTWSGEVGYEKLTKELIELGYEDDDVITDGQKAVILCSY